MGCDIHCYVEHKRKGFDRWEDFGGRINPGRNYWMVGTMAGVRRDDFPHIEPRGIAPDMGYSAADDCWIFIVEKPAEGGDCCSPETAQQYMRHGAVLKEPDQPLIHNRVQHPDWHSHSWISADEFELAIACYLKASGFQINTLRLPAPTEIKFDQLSTSEERDSHAMEYITEYWAILAAMRCFEMQGRDTRLVFWFDN